MAEAKLESTVEIISCSQWSYGRISKSSNIIIIIDMYTFASSEVYLDTWLFWYIYTVLLLAVYFLCFYIHTMIYVYILQGWVRSIAFEPYNEWFATGSADRTIKIWDLASGQLRLTLTVRQRTVYDARWERLTLLVTIVLLLTWAKPISS